MEKKDKKMQSDGLAYRVCRLGETEPAFSGDLLYHDEEGNYLCFCCDVCLFDASSKFDSGCGWPSFFIAKEGAIRYLDDLSHGMKRTEIRCAACDAHLGHVFDEPWTEHGKRYCVNSVSLTFFKKTQKDEL